MVCWVSRHFWTDTGSSKVTKPKPRLWPSGVRTICAGEEDQTAFWEVREGVVGSGLLPAVIITAVGLMRTGAVLKCSSGASGLQLLC